MSVLVVSGRGVVAKGNLLCGLVNPNYFVMNGNGFVAVWKMTKSVSSTFLYDIYNSSRYGSLIHAYSTTHKSNKSYSKASIPFYGEPRKQSAPFLSSLAYPSPDQNGMYHSLTTLQKISVAANSAFTALADPSRADAVAALGEVSGTVALRGMRDKMFLDPTGQRILADRPIVNQRSINFDDLERSGSNTFGAAYFRFMKLHGFHPEERDAVRYIEDDEISYVMLRHRQCHDYWHTLFDLPPNVYGELVLKWVELLQTNIPVAALSCTFGPLQLSSEKRNELLKIYLPWAIKTGMNSRFLLNIYYEEEFDSNIDNLRKQIGINPAPKSQLMNDMN